METNQNFGLSSRDCDTLFNIFKKYNSIQKVYVYGSRAKGTAHTGSDIDLALEVDDNENNTLILKLKTDFEESTLPYFVDIVNVKTLKKQSLLNEIKQSGKLFYTNEIEVVE